MDGDGCFVQLHDALAMALGSHSYTVRGSRKGFPVGKLLAVGALGLLD